MVSLGTKENFGVEIIKMVINIVKHIFKTVAPKLWDRFCLYWLTVQNGLKLRLLPNSAWIIKKISHGNLILKLSRNAYLPWHILYFNQIFDSFESYNGIIDLSVPSFLTMKKNQKQFFFLQAPEDDHVAKGYLAINKPNKNDIVFDIGAYCGVMSYVYSSLCQKVCAFEPNPYTYAALCTNILYYKLDNVAPYMAGIWPKTEEVDFTTDLGGGDMIGQLGVIGKNTSTTKIKVFNLEDAIKLTGCFPTHIKMDIERAELDVIKGNLDFIAKHNFKFAIACYHTLNGERVDKKLIEMFKSIGYKTELTYPEHLTLHAWKKN